MNGYSILRLQRFLAPLPNLRRCELCRETIPDDHFHVFNTETRKLLCACRACRLLFTREGAANGKYRTVPNRYVRLPAGLLTGIHWEELQIPVAIAFFVFHSSYGYPSAFYPGPAGLAESQLSPAVWKELGEAWPILKTLAPDVEAVLAYKKGESVAWYLVPIDACHELMGRMRQHWKGFSGGEEVWNQIEGFFEALEVRSS